MIIQKKNLRKVLFIDIETVSLTKEFDELNETMQMLWMKKATKFLPDRTMDMTEELAAALYTQKAAIFAEFAKVACISVGYLSKKKDEPSILRIKSFGGDEVDILSTFGELMDQHYDDPEEHFLCGHNIKEFDVPFLCRRMVINGIDIPRLLNISGKKPWQVAHLLDTMEMWKFGDYKNYTSLALLAGALGIPSPKDDIDGSDVGRVFYEEEDLPRIIHYCEKDVLTVVQVVMKFAGQDLMPEERIDFIPYEE